MERRSANSVTPATSRSKLRAILVLRRPSLAEPELSVLVGIFRDSCHVFDGPVLLLFFLSPLTLLLATGAVVPCLLDARGSEAGFKSQQPTALQSKTTAIFRARYISYVDDIYAQGLFNISSLQTVPALPPHRLLAFVTSHGFEYDFMRIKVAEHSF